MAAPARSKKADTATAERYRHYLRQMLLIRRFEEKAGEAYSLGKIGGFCHLYIGQEAVAVGHHRRAAPRRLHHLLLPRARPRPGPGHVGPGACMAELFGKATGCSKGKGGSMHLFDAALGFLGGHGIVGGHIPLTAGTAFAIKYRGGDEVAVCFFGEAAANNGAFHEALNMAGALEAAGHLHLREQPLRHGHGARPGQRDLRHLASAAAPTT